MPTKAIKQQSNKYTLETNNTPGQHPAATQTKVINLEHFNQSLKEEIAILQSCTQNVGTDISNLFEMMDQQLFIAVERSEELPEAEKMDILKSLWFMETILRQIRTKVNNQLFWAIDNVVYELRYKK